MRNVVGQLWKQVTLVVLLVGMDIVIGLPILGATYRPFGWMSTAPANVVTLYPVIQDWSFVDGQPTFLVEASAGAQVILLRNTNLLDAAGWRDVASTTALERRLLLIDTNPVGRAAFYRVEQLLGGVP